MWLKDSPRTCTGGFKPRLITKGPPVRVGLDRLSRADAEWVEQAIVEDATRRELRGSNSAWGFPAFPTKEPAPQGYQEGKALSSGLPWS